MSLLFHDSKWDDKDISKLIKLIEEHPVLWNSKMENYKDLNSRESAFNDIAEEMDMPPDEIRKKYRNLRTQYIREVRYIKKRGYRSRWAFYESLRFLSSGQSERKRFNWDDPMIQEELNRKYNVVEEEDLKYEEEYLDEALDDISQNVPEYLKSNATNLKLSNSQKDGKTGKERPTILVMKPHQRKKDDYEILGEHVANEMRLLKNRKELQHSLKCAILRAILEVNKQKLQIDADS